MSDQQADESAGAAVGPSDNSPHAALGLRFAARAVDLLLLAAVSFFVLPFIAVFGIYTSAQPSTWLPEDPVGLFFEGATWGTIMFVYFVAMESFFGQTVGKMTVKIRTLGPHGQRLSFQRAIRRNLWLLLLALPGVGFGAVILAAVTIAATIGQSDTNTGWHDRLAGGTRVVRLE